MTFLLGTLILVLSLVFPSEADAFCGCRAARIPRCEDPDAKHRITVQLDLTVVDGTIEILTQSGPYRMPPAHIDGKPILAAFMPRGEIFQGFLDEAVTIAGGTVTGTGAVVETTAAFPPGEYELCVFRSRYAREGFLEEDGEIWSASGDLLAHSRQLALLL